MRGLKTRRSRLLSGRKCTVVGRTTTLQVRLINVHWVRNMNCDYWWMGMVKWLRLRFLDCGRSIDGRRDIDYVWQGRSDIHLNPTSCYRKWGSWDRELLRIQVPIQLLHDVRDKGERLRFAPVLVDLIRRLLLQLPQILLVVSVMLLRRQMRLREYALVTIEEEIAAG